MKVKTWKYYADVSPYIEAFWHKVFFKMESRTLEFSTEPLCQSVSAAGEEVLLFLSLCTQSLISRKYLLCRASGDELLNGASFTDQRLMLLRAVLCSFVCVFLLVSPSGSISPASGILTAIFNTAWRNTAKSSYMNACACHCGYSCVCVCQ